MGIYHLSAAVPRNFPPLVGVQKTHEQPQWQDARQQGRGSHLDISLSSTGLPLRDCVLGKNAKKVRDFGTISEVDEVHSESLEIIKMANSRQGDEVEKFVFGFPPNSPENLLSHLSLWLPSRQLSQDSRS